MFTTTYFSLLAIASLFQKKMAGINPTLVPKIWVKYTRQKSPANIKIVNEKLTVIIE